MVVPGATSTVSAIPKKATLAVGPLNVRYVPPLEYREMSGFDALDADWAALCSLRSQMGVTF